MWYQSKVAARVVGIGAGIVGRGVADRPAQKGRRSLPNADGGRPFRAETWMVSAFGGARGRTDVPRIVDWYMDGKIEIDSLITHTMPLEEINTALDLMHRSESIRSVINSTQPVSPASSSVLKHNAQSARVVLPHQMGGIITL